MINQRHVSDVYGPIPAGTRYPTPAAKLVGQTLSTALPELSPAAGKVIAQHLHRCACSDPHKGTAEALTSVAKDFNLSPGTFSGPPGMERAVHENHPLPAFLNEARRLTNGTPEGGFDFSFLKKVAENPMAKMVADLAMKKALGGESVGGEPLGGDVLASLFPKLNKNMVAGFKRQQREAEGGFDLSFLKKAAAHPMGQAAADMAMKKLFGGGELGGSADELVSIAKAHSKLSKKQQLQALQDSKVRKSSLYDAFKA